MHTLKKYNTSAHQCHNVILDNQSGLKRGENLQTVVSPLLLLTWYRLSYKVSICSLSSFCSMLPFDFYSMLLFLDFIMWILRLKMISYISFTITHVSITYPDVIQVPEFLSDEFSSSKYFYVFVLVLCIDDWLRRMSSHLDVTWGNFHTVIQAWFLIA